MELCVELLHAMPCMISLGCPYRIPPIQKAKSVNYSHTYCIVVHLCCNADAPIDRSTDLGLPIDELHLDFTRVDTWLVLSGRLLR